MRHRILECSVAVLTALFIAGCLPVSGSKKSDARSNSRRTVSSDSAKVFINKVVSGQAGKYEVLVAVDSSVQGMMLCDQRAVDVARCDEQIAGFQRLTESKSKRGNKKLFSVAAFEVIDGGSLFLYAGTDSKNKQLIRNIAFKDLKWQPAQTIMTKSCAGANCHVNSSGSQIKYWENPTLVFDSRVALMKRLTTTVAGTKMPPTDDRIAAADKQVLVDYLKLIDPSLQPTKP